MVLASTSTRHHRQSLAGALKVPQPRHAGLLLGWGVHDHNPGRRTRSQAGPDLSIVGSTALVRDLHGAGLIDHYTPVIHPVTLGSGRRMFEGTAPLARFALAGSVTTSRGVIVAHYDRR